ncbi:MAG: RNA 2',3'-cyclic phosphodiesterase [Myxococcales bacterium]|nr:RNA 2',3'-cyclic phosphodiesterase [Myxococcales bacterium]
MSENVKPGATPDVKPGAAPDVKPGAAPDVKPGAAPDLKPGAAADVKPGATPDAVADAPREPKLAAGLRLFFGVNLALDSAQRIADATDRLQKLAGSRVRAAWVPAANLHVTLRFLGWTREEAVPALRDAVREGLRGRKAFTISTRGLGAFPSLLAPKVLWVGVQDPSGGLARLARDLESWMRRLGYPAENRPFHPHVTIARVKEGRVDEGQSGIKDADFGTSLVREVILYESTVTPIGSEYRALARIPLDAPPYRAERQTREVLEGIHSEEPGNHGGSKSA